MTRQYDNYADLITFSRSSSGTALRPISYGDELVTNGDDFSSGWTTGGWTISSEQASATGNGTNQNLYGTPVSNAVAGKLYQLSYEVISSSVAAGNLRAGAYSGASFFGGSYFTLNTTVGTHVVNFVGSPSGSGSVLDFWLYAGATSGTLVLDNISVKEVTFDQPNAPLTLFNHPAGIPRIEYDADGNVLGLLVEEQRTNLVTYSEDFTNAAWGKSASGAGSVPTVTASYAASPDGTNSASRVQMSVGAGTTSSDYSLLRFTISSPPSPLMCSLWVKSNTGSNQTFKLSYGAAGGVFTATSEWQRFDGLSANTSFADLCIRGDETGQSLDVLIWGYQGETGAFPTSYIPTSGSTATRSADLAGIPVSAFGYNQKSGTVVVEFKVNESSIIKRLASLNADNTSNRMDALLILANHIQLFVNDGGANQVGINTPNIYTDGNVATLAFSYEEDNYAVTLSGGTIASDTSASVPDITQLEIGSGPTGDYANGYIKSIKYFPRRLTNAQLQELTT
jgi:hypothetical protein